MCSFDFKFTIATAHLTLAQRGHAEKASDESWAQPVWSWQMADLLKTGLAVILCAPSPRARKKFIHSFNGMWCKKPPPNPKAIWTLFPLQPAQALLSVNCSMQLFHLRWHDPKKTALGCTLWLKCALVVVHPYNLCLDNKHKSGCFRSVMILICC